MNFFSCGIVEVPEGYRNVPDLTKRFPDCCINIIKLENSTKIDTNQTKIDGNQTRIDSISTKIDVNQTRIDGNVTRLDENMTKFENITKIEDNLINDNQKKLR